jgi:hypothetical protein
MTRLVLFLAAWPAVALSVGCASPAPGADAPSLRSAAADCSRIADELARAEQARQRAEHERTQAWKAVVPFAVASRYVRAGDAADAAGRQLQALRAASLQHGCSPG